MKKVAAVFLAAVFAACGSDSSSSSSSSTTPTKKISVTISPSTAEVETGAKQTFTAKVINAKDQTVTWSVKEDGGGTIDAEGTYTAPAAAGSFTVVATAKADKTKFAEASVTVVTPAQGAVSVSISPATKSLQINQTAAFTATVQGSDDTGVTWSVVEGSGGSVSSSGVYTAPGFAGVFHVKATSTADSSKSAQATVTVSLPPSNASVIITPASASIYTDGQIDFSADLVGGSGGVDFSVLEAGGGTINGGGTYTAPSTPGVYHVIATSKSDPNASASATVTVYAATYTVTITPTFATVATGSSFKFVGTVDGDSFGNPLTWYVKQVNGGWVGGTGTYTAPITPGTYNVIAVSKDNPLKQAQVTVSVVAANPIIKIVPVNYATVETGQTRDYEVSVTNTVWNKWTLALSPNSSDSGWLSVTSGTGRVTVTYTAPITAGTYALVAKTVNLPQKTATVNVTVTGPNPWVNLSPASVTVFATKSYDFSADVTGSVYTQLVWSIPGNTAEDFGTIDQNGHYTAPVTPGTYTIKVASLTLPSRFKTATVTVVAAYCPVNTRQVRWTLTEDNPDGIELAVPLDSSNDVVSQVTILRYSSATTHTGFNIISEFLPDSLYFDYMADNVTQVVTYTGKGPDGIMGTADDVIGSLVNLTYFPPSDANVGRLKGYAFMVSGADEKLGTPDDEVLYGAEFTWDGSGYVDMIVNYVELGLSGSAIANGEITSVEKYDFSYQSYEWVYNCWPSGGCWYNGYGHYGQKFSSAGVDGVWNLDPAQYRDVSNDGFSGYVVRIYGGDSTGRQPLLIGERRGNDNPLTIRFIPNRSGDYLTDWEYQYFYTGNGSQRLIGQSYYPWAYDSTSLGFATNWPRYIGLYDNHGWYGQGHQRVCP